MKKFAVLGRAGKLKHAATISWKTSPAVRLKETVEGSVMAARVQSLKRLEQTKQIVANKLKKDWDDAKSLVKEASDAVNEKASVLGKYLFGSQENVALEGAGYVKFENSGNLGNIHKGTTRNTGENSVKTFVGQGEQFTNGRKNKLKPNIRYKAGEFDYFYETDNLGRLVTFETENLQLTKRKNRLSHSRNTPGKVKGQDHAGHLAGDRFGGSPRLDNLVSQLSDVNLKQYKKIEDTWAAALKEKPPKKVTVDVEIVYTGNDVRPEKFIIDYFIDGQPGSKILYN